MSNTAVKMEYEKRVGDYTVRCVNGCFQPEITEFVARVYYSQKNFKFDTGFDCILEKMMEEDESLKDYTTTFTAYNEKDEIVASVRKIISVHDNLLPVEREFGVDFARVMKQYLPINEIWEIARFASIGAGISAMKIVLKEGIASSNRDDLLLAGLDARVLYVLRRMGFPWVDIGQAKEYLGSLTQPTAVSVRDVTGEFSLQRLQVAV